MIRPLIITRCADCDVGTLTLGEWYMVKDDIWRQAWGRLKPWHKLPGQQILCIACLEWRLGRALLRCDFTDALVNDPTKPNISERLRDRLTADWRPPMQLAPCLRARCRSGDCSSEFR